MPKRKPPEPKELTHRTEGELEVEVQTGHRLTMRQKRFADRFAEGNITATGAAIEAGYSPKAASQQASRFLNPKYSPQVVAYLAYLRDEMQAQYGVTREGMLKRLYDLSRGAEAAGQFSSAVNSERIRASLAGLTIDRRETVNTIHDMSKGQILERLAELKRKHPGAFEVVEGSYTEPVPIEDAVLIEDSSGKE